MVTINMSSEPGASGKTCPDAMDLMLLLGED